MSVATIRGAITTDNSTVDILRDTTIMLEEIISANGLDLGDITSILFTATKDLTSTYPAVAARGLGITNASLMCMQEMFVENSLEKCIRCMVTVKTIKQQNEMVHVYLKGAKMLRPDLKSK